MELAAYAFMSGLAGIIVIRRGERLAQFGQAAQEVAITLKGIREGDGFARDVLFGGNGDTKDAISNVTQLTADMRDIVASVKQGKGTVGALLVEAARRDDVFNADEQDAIKRLLAERFDLSDADTQDLFDVAEAASAASARRSRAALCVNRIT